MEARLNKIENSHLGSDSLVAFERRNELLGSCIDVNLSEKEFMVSGLQDNEQ